VTDNNATDSKSPADRLLELVVFGPAGLAVTIVEEFPKLVEKGRHRIEGQVHTARLVGQFAIQMGRRQLGESLGHIGAQWGPHGSEGTTARGDEDDEDLDFDHAAPPDDSTHPAASALATSPAQSPGPTRSPDPIPPFDPTQSGRPIQSGTPIRPAGPSAAPSVWLGTGAGNGTGSASGLAIPGYDSLSASQVVQRLEGLSSSELEEVRAHEAAHRQRRTILHRVEQLLDGGPSVQP
jgi:hypothetical protein